MFAERSGIYLENLKREKSTIIKASVPVKEFKNVAKIAKESKCKIKIKSKKGLPFILVLSVIIIHRFIIISIIFTSYTVWIYLEY